MAKTKPEDVKTGADAPEVLIGSSILPAMVQIADGKEVQLGEVVAAAHLASGLSVEDWNALPDDEREAKLVVQVAALQAAAEAEAEAAEAAKAEADALAAAAAEQAAAAEAAAPEAPKKAKRHATPEKIALKLTAAIAISGLIHKAGSIVELGEKEAKDLLQRGKAVIATE